jgi:hypothetical protein
MKKIQTVLSMTVALSESIFVPGKGWEKSRLLLWGVV